MHKFSTGQSTEKTPLVHRSEKWKKAFIFLFFPCRKKSNSTFPQHSIIITTIIILNITNHQVKDVGCQTSAGKNSKKNFAKKRHYSVDKIFLYGIL